MSKFGDMTVIGRAAWHAEKPNGTRTRRAPSGITEVFFHWPGSDPRTWASVNTEEEERNTIKGFQSYHIHGHGWTDIGYNHVLGHAGDVPRLYTARGAQYLPAAQLEHNTGTLACCVLIGPDDTLTDALVNRMRSYVRACEAYAGHHLRVRGHGEVTDTDCPGPQIRRAIAAGRLTV